MIVAIDAETTDQLGDLLVRRNLAGHALDLGAPAGAPIGRHDGIGDIGQVTQVGRLDVVANVEDDDVLVGGIGLEPFSRHQRGDVGGLGSNRGRQQHRGSSNKGKTHLIVLRER